MADTNDFVKRLREDPMYKSALGRTRSKAERKAISTLVEGLVGGIGAVLGPLIERAQHDPEFASQLNKAINGDKDVLTVSESMTSGSNA